MQIPPPLVRACIAALALTPPALCGEGGQPYTAVVVGGAAAVVSGPGPQYYETAELPAGSEVEVYDETPTGYCAIRPPEGSFSWAPASAFELLEDDVARVTRDQAPARVGSLLNDRRDAVHVRLDIGERVRVLAQQDIDGVRWLQIAPPAGEFRWVRRDQIRPQPAAQAAVGEDSGWVQTAAHTEEPTSPRAEDTSSPPAPTGQVVGARPLPAAEAAPAPTIVLSGEFGQRVRALEVELARQVSETPTLWRFEEIEQYAAALMSSAQDDQQRAAVRDLAARVDRFAAIANRYKASRGLAPQVALTKSTAPLLGAPRVVPVDAGAVNGVNEGSGQQAYDAVGVLRPVVSKRPDAPQYALVDEQGGIVSFVTAGPDLGLAALVGRRVGVQGVKGFMPEYQQPHVAAQRVASLGGAVR